MSELDTSLRIRRAARIILIDPAQRILLFRFDVSDRPPFWVTAGGECEPSETFEQAAQRELFEETGIRADAGAQIARTTPKFRTVEGEVVQADERYFLLRVAHASIDTSGHTALEQKVMTQHRWFARNDLFDWPEPVFPETLLDIIDSV